MKLPALLEAEQPLVKPLLVFTDYDLLRSRLQDRRQGKYFTALFCRYGHLVYSVLHHHARTQVQVDYLFACTWREIFQALAQFTSPLPTDEKGSLSSWLLSFVSSTVHQGKIPAVESIHYSLQSAPPPLWYYLEESLFQMPPLTRLIMLMAQTFHWSPTRIAAYLESEGEVLSVQHIEGHLQEGYQLLEQLLPRDIRKIYLNSVGVIAEDFAAKMTD
jgi:hypothetical protein